MSNPRVRKIADRIQVIVAEMLERRIKDPRLGFVTVTDVRVTGDTQQASVFYTVLGEEDGPGEHGGRARVGQGPDPLRGRQAARHAARADAGRSSTTRCPRPPGTSTRCSRRRASADAEVAARPRGATYAGEADPYKKPREDDEDDEPRRGLELTSDVTATSGLVVVDKPAGMTSHDVVARVRRLAGTRKVGHAGTLDPMATGVLVLGVDRATRLLGHLMLTDKAYDATVRLGAATTTDDAEGEVARDRAGRRPRPRTACAPALAAFVGEIEQVPSAVSAIKVDGKRAYAPGARRRAGRARGPAGHGPRARRCTDVRRGGDGSTSTSRCAARSGTYIRAIARDLGAALGRRRPPDRAAAYGRRARSTSTQARTLDELGRRLRRAADRRRGPGRLPGASTSTTTQAADVRVGRAARPRRSTGPTAVFAPDGEFLALYEPRDGRARAVAVLLSGRHRRIASRCIVAA